MFAVLLPQREDYWVLTHEDARTATAINVGGSFLTENEGSILAIAYTVHRRGTERSRWTTPAYTLEMLRFRCSDQTYRVARSYPYTAMADAWLPSNPDLTFHPVPKAGNRRLQLEAVCHPRPKREGDWSDEFQFLAAYGVRTREWRLHPTSANARTGNVPNAFT